MPSSYRVRVAAVLALLLCLGTLRGAVAFEAKTKSAGSLTTISRITTKNENGQIAAIIDADGPLTYKTFSLHKPERVVLDLTGARSTIQEKGIEVSSQRLERIRVGAQDSNGVRIVFDVKEQCQFQVQTIARGLAIYFSESAKMSNTAQKADAKKTVAAPPTAPPDTTGLVAGSAGKEKKEEGQTKARNDNEQVAKVETKKDSAEGRVPANLPSVKGPAVRPGITRAAARPAAPAPAPTSDNPAEPQSQKLRFGEPGFVGDPISIDIAGVDINDILRFISDNYGENFILDKSVGLVNVTVKVNDVPWNQVLDSIFKANQLSYIREGLIVRIATLNALAEEQEKQRRIEDEKINNLPKVSKFFRLRYTRLSGGLGAGLNTTAGIGGTQAGAGGATGLLGIIRKNLSKVGEVDSDPRTNQIIITDIPQKVASVEDIIKKLDVPEPQVEIEARVVIANRTFMRSIGNQFLTSGTQGSHGNVGSAFGPFSSPFDANATAADGNGSGTGPGRGSTMNKDIVPSNVPDRLVFLTTGMFGTTMIRNALTASEQKGISKTISTPRVTVQNNTPADITAGTQISVQTEVNNTITTTFVTAALRLNVTPQIADEGNVLLRIVVENNSVDRSLRTNGGTPSITTQRAETLVLVPDGGTTILGGINVDSEANNQQRTPGISRIPYLGELFKKRSVDRNSQELLFFVTPRIYRPESFGAQSAPPSPAPTQSVVSGPEAVTGGER